MFPKIISIGSFYLPTYGVLVALAFLAGLAITVRLAKRSGLNPQLISDLAIYCALAGLLGAKLLMIVFDWGDPDKPPIFSLPTIQAAGVWQGGLILAIATALYFVRRHKLPLLQTFDVFAPGIALGHSIGRIGCLAAGCCWGKECTLPWAITFSNPDANALTGVPLGLSLHPSQIYEMLTEAALFAFLYWRFNRAHSPGRIIGLYLVLSSVARFLIEFTRFHEQGLYFSLSITQWISIALIVAGMPLLVRAPAQINPPVAA